MTDLQMTAERLKIPVQVTPKHRHLEHSFKAQRLLAAVDDNDDRRQLSETLYAAYWEKNLDIQDPEVMKQIFP